MKDDNTLPETANDELTLLYQRARMEWDERLGNIVAFNHKLITISIISGLATLLAVCGVIYIGAQSKIEPYVLAMSDTKLVALQAAQRMPMDEKKRLEITQLSDFVTHVRSVFTDINAQREYVIKAYAHLRSTDPAFIQVNQYLSETAPPHKRAETEAVTLPRARVATDLAMPVSASRVRSGAYQLITGINPPDKSCTSPLAPKALRGLWQAAQWPKPVTK